ncbi:unnamed protein product, partial [Gongylonema pulchrum]|uniref:Uncharacterized protein n=1 Tax=Gongylonema pulchrum TaxID=637853 RepID=A0A183F150_9BILA
MRLGDLPSSSEGDDAIALISCQFVAVAAQWFDHVVSEVKNTEHQFSVKKHSFHCESDHSVQKTFNAIRDRLCGILHNETVTVYQLQMSGTKRFSSHFAPTELITTFA